MRGLHKVLAVLVALAALAAAAFAAAGPGVAPVSTAAMTPASVALAFEWAIDFERGQRGLPALVVDAVETTQAAKWSTLMAFTGTLAEDPNSQAAIAAYVPNWQLWGENVGVGPTPQSV
jgi:hypothetical protein